MGGKEEGEPEERQGGKVDNGTAYTHSVFNWIAGKYGELREKKKNWNKQKKKSFATFGLPSLRTKEPDTFPLAAEEAAHNFYYK